MTPPQFLSADEGTKIQHALAEGQADRAFTLLATYLQHNNIRLSDEVMRLYIEQELFDCLVDKGQIFRDMLHS